MDDYLAVRLCRNFQNKQADSWWARVTENARAFFALRAAKPCAGNGGVFDLLDAGPAPGTRQRQAVSILVHGVVILTLLVMGSRVVPKLAQSQDIFTGRNLPPFHWPNPPQLAEGPGGTNGSGGRLGIEPPSAGSFAARAQLVLLHPRVPDQREHLLPVEPTIFDANMNEAKHVVLLGLPNMRERNDSNGPGKNDGIGANGPGNSMGTGTGDGVADAGDGPRSGYGAYPVQCLYCPDPEYTDEARQEKLQGSVTLRVLVTKDGRAGQVKIVKGLGLGLDERALATVRTWRFQPAHDANKNPIPEWVTVETTYRLF